MHLSLSVEETNQLRLRLGLRPIPLATSGNNDDLGPEYIESGVGSVVVPENQTFGPDADGPTSNAHSGSFEDQFLELDGKDDDVPVEKAESAEPAQDVPAPNEKAKSDSKSDDSLQKPPAEKPTIKPKKVRAKAKPRKRQPAKPPVEKRDPLSADSLSYYSQLLQHARMHIACRPMIPINPHPQYYIQTEAFLRRLHANRPPPAQLQPQLQPQASKPRTKRKVPTTADKRAAAEKSSNSVAETLANIREQSKVEPKSRSSKGKWAQQLTAARKKREQEAVEMEAKVQALPVNEREQALKIHRERQHAELVREAEVVQKNYEPEVEIRHHDEHGSAISSREAFKSISRAFHKGT